MSGQSIEGRAGDDLLTGGAGGDTLNGGSGNDTASYAGSTGAVTVLLYSGVGMRGDAEGDQLIGIENIIGSNFDDILTGSFLGGQLIEGRAGDDLLTGGAGGDTLSGGSGNDTVSYAGSTGAVTVLLYSGVGSRGDAEGDQLIGIENIIGSNFDDILTGSFLSGQLIEGRAGDDILKGGAGADMLTGGSGSDTFVFKVGYDADTITDFSFVQGDVIDISTISGFNDVTDLAAIHAQSGDDSVFDFGGGDVLVVQDTLLSAFDNNDFIF